MADLMELDGHAEKIRQATLRFGQNFAEWVSSVAVELRDAQRKLARRKSGSFQAWCRDRLKWNPNYVRKLLAADESLQMIKSGTMVPLLPTTERQCRELSVVPKSDVAKVWGKVVEHAEAEGVEVTAKLVRQFAEPYREPPKPSAPSEPQPFNEDEAGRRLRSLLRRELEKWPRANLDVAKHWIRQIIEKEFA